MIAGAHATGAEYAARRERAPLLPYHPSNDDNDRGRDDDGCPDPTRLAGHNSAMLSYFDFFFKGATPCPTARPARPDTPASNSCRADQFATPAPGAAARFAI